MQLPRTQVLAPLLVVALACHEEPSPIRHEPMRPPAASVPPAAPSVSAASDDPAAAEPPAPVAERPPADPAITKAIDLIGGSGLRFIDQADDDDSKPSEYTAEQFASMLRTKWDWIGYDIAELDTWLEEIGSRSFKTNLPYQVVLTDGTHVELRGWLDQRLAASDEP
ncbi:DUF5329 family protein [Enhygromyxa salina]|uniref:DUF5329 family protein n=1 Tax=Enhygromyxa salina TaxID=215803 RepID=UPI0011B295E3|nr:DUF5329 family protein [Enhygromyxa salina]